MAPARKLKAFLEQMGTNSPFYKLFEHLPGISFFAKNDRFELVCANSAFLERLGFASEADIIGKTDYDLFPQSLADHFREDDVWVIAHRRPRHQPLFIDGNLRAPGAQQTRQRTEHQEQQKPKPFVRRCHGSMIQYRSRFVHIGRDTTLLIFDQSRASGIAQWNQGFSSYFVTTAAFPEMAVMADAAAFRTRRTGCFNRLVNAGIATTALVPMAPNTCTDFSCTSQSPGFDKTVTNAGIVALASVPIAAITLIA
jgi:PAS fold